MTSSTPAAHVDLLVIGGGPVGLAAARHAAVRGLDVLVLEQFDLFTQRGSSGGDERQWRIQYSQEDLARLTLDARELWADLEQASGRRLVHETGSLWFGDVSMATNEGQIGAAASVLDRIGVSYDWLTAKEIEDRFPFVALPADYEGFFQPDGGSIDVRGTLWVLHDLAQRAGARVLAGRRVDAIEPDSDGVTVRAAGESYRADQVVVTAGAYAAGLLAPLGVELDVHRFTMSSASFRLREREISLPSWFAFQQPTEHDTNLFYGFGAAPWSNGDIVRAGPDFEDHHVPDPYDAGNVAVPAHLARLVGWVAKHLPVLDPDPVCSAGHVAVLPADPERQFYFGRPPADTAGADRIVVFSAGWGFKFVPLLGRACVEVAVDGRTSYNLDRFALAPA